MTEEIQYSTAASTRFESAHETRASTEKLDTQSVVRPSPSSANRTFAPLNTPFYRRRQTLTILVSWTMPWFCLYISLLLLRSNNWYVFLGFIAYLTWMVLFRKYPQQGGLRQQWFRRLAWWKWFAG
ncbi:unnamed protein product [Rotaria sordida]|uniref:Uncharacterized protein n=1 Tax=Rotaria sordida TaxID=392033 RepID=A0A814WTR7_9BILA|nr:unnamed protein product [Rotaria sordida]